MNVDLHEHALRKVGDASRERIAAAVREAVWMLGLVNDKRHQDTRHKVQNQLRERMVALVRSEVDASHYNEDEKDCLRQAARCLATASYDEGYRDHATCRVCKAEGLRPVHEANCPVYWVETMVGSAR